MKPVLNNGTSAFKKQTGYISIIIGSIIGLLFVFK